ncbi:MAG TPA: heme-binding protein [Polyangiaceae bacterium]
MVALPVLGLGVAGLLGRGPALLRRHPVLSAALACGGMVVLAKSQFDRFFLEEPDYEVVQRLNGLEVRLYSERNVAETTVNAGTFDEARRQGFQRLADYLFGENVPGEKLARTVSYSVSRKGSRRDGERLAMTTPVTLGPAQSAGGYVMRFQMPKARELDSLPRPKDPRISLRRLPEELVAVLRFSGSYDGALIAQREREFRYRMEAAGLIAGSEPTFAGYDSPAALPPLRRVEIWATVA